MKGKKNETTRNNEQEQEILEELFSSSDSDSVINLDESFLSAIGPLISYTTAVGGMATFYRSATGDNIGISLRLGKRKRSLSIDGDDISLRELITFTDGIKRLWLHQHQLRNATRLDEEAVKSKKK